jgi:hypothetical protein
MSRRGLSVVLASAVVVVLLGTGSGSAADGAQAPIVIKPRLFVAELYPLTVKGVSFRPRERVRVTVDGGTKGAKRVQATRRGKFTVRFAIQIPRCQTVTVRAVGGQGSRAVYQVPRPNCREP